MAKQNKSLTIGILVVAGVLLFLIGSYTGQITAARIGRTEGQSCNRFMKCTNDLMCVNRICTNPTTPPVGSTVEPLTKQDVLNMLNSCTFAGVVGDEYNNSGWSGDKLCKESGKVCVTAFIADPNKKNVNIFSTYLTYCRYSISINKDVQLTALCCSP